MDDVHRLANLVFQKPIAGRADTGSGHDKVAVSRLQQADIFGYPKRCGPEVFLFDVPDKIFLLLNQLCTLCPVTEVWIL